MTKSRKIIAFAASNSRNSINKQLVAYAGGLVPDAELEVLDLNDYELPLFSVDREAELGQPVLARQFVDKLNGADAILISFAEHNGSYSAAYKSLFDWCTRIQKKLFEGKPMVLLATSPGARGAASVLAAATNSVPFFGGDVKASLSIPSFNENFDVEAGRLKSGPLHDQLEAAVRLL